MKKRKNNRKKIKKAVEKICKNCLLYDTKANMCRVTVLMEGQRINLPTLPTDPCFFEEEIIIVDDKGMQIDRFKPQVDQVKWWVEDPVTGKKASKGIVKMEYPPSWGKTPAGDGIDPETFFKENTFSKNDK